MPLTFAFTAPALAEDKPASTSPAVDTSQATPRERPFGVRLDVGYFQSSFVGLALSYKVKPFLQLELSSQFLLPGVTFFPRFSFGKEHRIVAAPGVGIFFAPVQLTNPLQVDRYLALPPPLWAIAFHLILEVGYEYRADNGFFFLATAGVMAYIIPDVQSGAVPHIRLGFGYYF
jgi:hypothetical protein